MTAQKPPAAGTANHGAGPGYLPGPAAESPRWLNPARLTFPRAGAAIGARGISVPVLRRRRRQNGAGRLAARACDMSSSRWTPQASWKDPARRAVRQSSREVLAGSGILAAAFFAVKSLNSVGAEQRLNCRGVGARSSGQVRRGTELLLLPCPLQL